MTFARFMAGSGLTIAVGNDEGRKVSPHSFVRQATDAATRGDSRYLEWDLVENPRGIDGAISARGASEKLGRAVRHAKGRITSRRLAAGWRILGFADIAVRTCSRHGRLTIFPEATPRGDGRREAWLPVHRDAFVGLHDDIGVPTEAIGGMEGLEFLDACIADLSALGGRALDEARETRIALSSHGAPSMASILDDDMEHTPSTRDGMTEAQLVLDAILDCVAPRLTQTPATGTKRLPTCAVRRFAMSRMDSATLRTAWRASRPTRLRRLADALASREGDPEAIALLHDAEDRLQRTNGPDGAEPHRPTGKHWPGRSTATIPTYRKDSATLRPPS